MLNLELNLQEVRRKVLKPKSKLTLVEWAEEFRFLSPEASSTPGRWRTSMVEPARGPMEAFTDPKVRKITIMACTQLLKTEFINNAVAYSIHQDPSPIIVMQPIGTLADTWSKDRFDPMVRDTPVLRELIADKSKRDSGNTINHKLFPGGHLTIIGSNSTSEVAARPIRRVFKDELDKYEDNIEGSPEKLIAERMATFWNSMEVEVCSPTIKGRSKIEASYLASDQRKYFVPCPHCGTEQTLIWAQVRWQNKDAQTAAYECEDCTVLWTEKDRLAAIKKGKYIATAPFNGHAGFHVNKLASPWEPLSKLVQKFLDAQGKPNELKVFVNTQLAETWEEKGEAPEHVRLYERRELYPINSCPQGVLFLTAACDVQKDRLEVEICGWGRGKQSWSIDYRVFMGETTTEAPWLELDKVLNETWKLSNGSEVQVRILAIDSGFNTQHVYNWARKYTGNRVMVVKGRDDQQNILGTPSAADVTHNGKKVKRGVRVWPVGVSTLKSELYGFLNLRGAGDDGIYPPGYCHFPQYDENYFKGLTAEQLMTSIVKGKAVHRWEKKYERNEPLDLRNYNRAASAMFGIDRFKEKDWLNLEGKKAVVQEETPEQTEVKQQPKQIIQPRNNKPFLKPNPFLKGKKSFW